MTDEAHLLQLMGGVTLLMTLENIVKTTSKYFHDIMEGEMVEQK